MSDVLLPYEADGGKGIIEKYGYASTVIRSYDGTEQRVALRRAPVGGIEYQLLHDQAINGQRFNATLYGNLPGVFAVPLWPYATRPAANIAAGANTVTLSSTLIPFKDVTATGKYVLLWQSDTVYELHQIDTIVGTTLTMLVNTTIAFSAAGSWVLPVRRALLSPEVVATWLTNKAVSGTVDATFEAAETPEASAEFISFGGQVLPAL